jgi:hypothetical protein
VHVSKGSSAKVKFVSERRVTSDAKRLPTLRLRLTTSLSRTVSDQLTKVQRSLAQPLTTESAILSSALDSEPGISLPILTIGLTGSFHLPWH